MGHLTLCSTRQRLVCISGTLEGFAAENATALTIPSGKGVGSQFSPRMSNITLM